MQITYKISSYIGVSGGLGVGEDVRSATFSGPDNANWRVRPAPRQGLPESRQPAPGLLRSSDTPLSRNRGRSGVYHGRVG